jgi:CubicO group peptidase (beta-lactamase class C family)
MSSLGPWGSAIQDFLGSDPIGWSYAIGQNGSLLESGAVGYAVAPWDTSGNTEEFATDTGITFASCSKSITAVAMMTLFQNPPAGWNWGGNLLIMLNETFNLYTSGAISSPGSGPPGDPGAGVAGVTIGQLLTMMGGMWPQQALFDDYLTAMTPFVQNACQTVPGQSYNYINSNFSIMQLVLAGLQGSTDYTQYVPYVQKNVFAPMGITDVQDAPFFNTLTYSPGQSAGTGFAWPQITSATACGGWCGTVLDLASFLMGIRNNLVLTAANAQLMFNLGLGWYPWALDDGTNAWWHNGGLLNGDTPAQGLMTMIMSMPNGYDAAWICNTYGPWDWYKCLAYAYNQVVGTTADIHKIVKPNGWHEAVRHHPRPK